MLVAFPHELTDGAFVPLPEAHRQRPPTQLYEALE